MAIEIRLIQPQDNAAVAELVKSVLAEFGYTGPGIAAADPELEDMFATYQAPGSQYWVIVASETQAVLGAGGYARLKGTLPEERICELQKVYCYSKLRGGGWGTTLLNQIIEQAKASGYRDMYLESLPKLDRAVSLYERLGFQHLKTHKGNTGHQARCPIYMSLLL